MGRSQSCPILNILLAPKDCESVRDESVLKKRSAPTELQWRAPFLGSEGTKEIQQVLLLLGRKLIKIRNDSVRFRAVAGVLLYGMNKTTICGAGAAIVKEEDTLT